MSRREIVARDSSNCNLFTLDGHFRARLSRVSSRRDQLRYQLLRSTEVDFSRDLAISTVRKGTAVLAETRRDSADLLRCYNFIHEQRAFSLYPRNGHVA